VTSLERLTLLGVQSRRTGLGRPLGGRILAALSEAGVRVWMTTESTLGQSFSVVIPEMDEANARKSVAEALAPELQSGDLRIEPVLSPVTLVTLVGENMGAQPNVAGKFLNSIGSAGIAVRAVAQGGGGFRHLGCGRGSAQRKTDHGADLDGRPRQFGAYQRHPVGVYAHAGEMVLARLAADPRDVVAGGFRLEDGVVDQGGDGRADPGRPVSGCRHILCVGFAFHRSTVERTIVMNQRLPLPGFLTAGCLRRQFRR